MASNPGRPIEDRPLDDGGFEDEPLPGYHRDRSAEETACHNAAEDTLDEMQTYLQELYGRYGLNQSKAAVQPAAASRRPDPSPGPKDPLPQGVSTVDPPVPRSLPDPKPPPERRGDILALRELSTRSARGAIAQFETGRIVAATWARFWLCFAALGLTLFFLRIVEPFTVRALSAAAVALILGVYWCAQFWLLTHRATRIGGKPARSAGGARAT